MVKTKMRSVRVEAEQRLTEETSTNMRIIKFVEAAAWRQV